MEDVHCPDLVPEGVSLQMQNIDFGKTAGDYRRYRQGFPETLFERLSGFGIGVAEQRVLDFGTGTGSLARGFARRGCIVTGVDISAELIRQAAELDLAAGVVVNYKLASAEDNGLPDATFDVVSAGQCWHWFDRERVAAEVRRLLVPEGRLVIAHFDWIRLPGNMVEATEVLIDAFNPEWKHSATWQLYNSGNGLHPAWLIDVGVAGFTSIETFSFDVDVLYTHEAWRGRIRASAGVSASLSPERVAEFDSAHRALLADRFPEDPMPVPHRVFALIATNPVV